MSLIININFFIFFRGFFRKLILYIKRKPKYPLFLNYLIQFTKKNKKIKC